MFNKNYTVLGKFISLSLFLAGIAGLADAFAGGILYPIFRSFFIVIGSLFTMVIGLIALRLFMEVDSALVHMPESTERQG